MARDILAEAAQKINELPEEQRPAFAQALHASLKFDRANPQASASPKQLEAEFGIPIEALVEQGVCLVKEDAYHFLQTAGRGMAIAKLRRKFSADYYRSVMERKVSKKGMRALVFTYAEVLCLGRYFAYQSTFPESLQTYLGEDAAAAAPAPVEAEAPVEAAAEEAPAEAPEAAAAE